MRNANSVRRPGAPSPQPDNDAIASIFDTDEELRSNCAACGEMIVGKMDDLAAHFLSCNGPG